jgi:hypothetical protein
VGEIAYVHAAAWLIVKVCPPIVRLPVRGEELTFTIALKPTTPLPLPLAPLVMLIQPMLLLAAVHAQPVGAVTVIDPDPPAPLTAWLVGDSETLHVVVPACVTVNVWLPIVSVPTRWAVLGFAAALNATEPFPLPFAPLVTVSQDELLLAAVHAHPAGAVTFADPVPPDATTLCPVGETVIVHGAVCPLCVTVNVFPAIERNPVRCEVPGFAATLYVADPFPLPFAGGLKVIHAALLVAVHVQPDPAVTLTEPLPPDPATVWLVGEIENVQAAS